MAAIYSPSERGFDERLTGIDRCQVALLREVVGQYGQRLVLKGGMAMRAVFGSLRLTKDIDFDRQPSLSMESLKAGMPKALVRAAANAGIRQPEAEITKLTSTTVRARLAGRAPTGEDLRFEVEISGRHEIPPEWKRQATVAPPASYGMAPFLVESYSNDALAAMKIAAAMSEARNAPRDIYDLQDLIAANANPVALLASRSPAQALEQIKGNALSKLEMIGFHLARDELLPYLPPDIREILTEERWLEYTLAVGSAIEQWCKAALEIQAQKPGEVHENPSTDVQSTPKSRSAK
jgi:predicted nucleotidyltransferase component of viral defense system